MSEDRPHLNDLKTGLVTLAGLASAVYWLGRADEDPDRQAVRVLGEYLEDVATDLHAKWERLYSAQRTRP